MLILKLTLKDKNLKLDQRESEECLQNKQDNFFCQYVHQIIFPRQNPTFHCVSLREGCLLTSMIEEDWVFVMKII